MSHIEIRCSVRVFAGVSEAEPQMTAWDEDQVRRTDLR